MRTSVFFVEQKTKSGLWLRCTFDLDTYDEAFSKAKPGNRIVERRPTTRGRYEVHTTEILPENFPQIVGR